MLPISPAFADAVRGTRLQRLRVESWLDGELLADDVPVADGALTVDRSLQVPESVKLTVPRLDRGTSWTPIEPDHPLQAYGQQLVISVGIDLEHEITEWLQIAWMTITNAEPVGDEVRISADGLLHLIKEATFVSPFQPSGTLTETVRALVEPALTVQIDGTLVDRNVPAGMQWDEDRLGALYEVLDAWPAVATVDPNGTLVVEPPPPDGPGTPVWHLHEDPDGGTVIRWQGGSGRDGLFNIVVARGEDDDGNPVQGVAADNVSTSPTRLGGPFHPLPVPFQFFSPLLKTVDQCRAAARTILERKRRTQSRKLRAETVPQPALQASDTVGVTATSLGLSAVDEDGAEVGVPAEIEGYVLPLVPQGGAMGLDLRLSNG